MTPSRSKNGGAHCLDHPGRSLTSGMLNSPVSGKGWTAPSTEMNNGVSSASTICTQTLSFDSRSRSFCPWKTSGKVTWIQWVGSRGAMLRVWPSHEIPHNPKIAANQAPPFPAGWVPRYTACNIFFPLAGQIDRGGFHEVPIGPIHLANLSRDH